MFLPVISLVLLSLSLAWTAFSRAGVWPSDWQPGLLLISLAALPYWLLTPKDRRAPPLPRMIISPLFGFLGYLAIQLLPIPNPLLNLLSPVRYGLATQLAPVTNVSTVPLTATPGLSVLHLATFLSYGLTGLTIRELAWRFKPNLWISALPLILIGATEAVLGLAQVFSSPSATEATGTYTNRDHFSGFLEMILSLSTIYGVALFKGPTRPQHLSVGSAARASLLWLASTFILAAIALSLSRMGFVVAILVLLTLAALYLSNSHPAQITRLGSIGLVAVALIVFLVVFPPNQLLERFADMATAGEMTSNNRLGLWKQTLPLISEFCLTGSGPGSYESVFLKHQLISNQFRVQFAHNDYLQYLVELGFFGSALFALFVTGILIRLIKEIKTTTNNDQRLLAIACIGSFFTIGLHSLADFNTYIPANGMTLAWIAGLAVSFTATGNAKPAPNHNPQPRLKTHARNPPFSIS